MTVKTGDAVWRGDLPSGTGVVKLGSGAFEGSYGFNSRFEDGPGTNPEELIAAAHAGCFSMALAHELASNGHKATSVRTTASVRLDKVEGGFAISQIALVTEAEVPGIDEAAFQERAESAKVNCPVSKALAATEITLKATLKA